jgi:queuine tRNA-ribosyltransferase
MFDIHFRDPGCAARTGILHTPHGDLETPLFLPVGTRSSVKAVGADELPNTGTVAVIANAFLLSLRPGSGAIGKLGGIHRFMGWGGGVFTDSGGFQMIRQGFLEKLDDEGILFRSPYDGKKVLMTPERCRDIQHDLGSDVAMALDVCPPHGAPREEVKEAVRRTVLWADRFWRSPPESDQLIFSIVQGGLDRDLRRSCLDELLEMPFHGLAIGGLSIGETKSEMFRVIDSLVECIPPDLPTYLMGVGSPEDILEAVSRGIDVFDSAFPTRNARHRTLFTSRGSINVRRSRFGGDPGPIEPGCTCLACSHYSRAYLSHLFDMEEMLAWRLASIHNLTFIQQLIKNTKIAIEKGNLPQWKDKFIERYQSSEG